MASYARMAVVCYSDVVSESLRYSDVVANACEPQNADIVLQKPCLSLSMPFSWDTTTFAVPASTTQTSDTDSDSGFDSHDVGYVCHWMCSSMSLKSMYHRECT